MDQFLAVALAHFLAVLIPGIGFFLIVRTATAHGRRAASAVCVGIATANGALIAAAFGGLSLIGDPTVLAWIELAGGAFLMWMGIAFWRASVSSTVDAGGSSGRVAWGRNFGMGLASGLLNPKNPWITRVAAVVVTILGIAFFGIGIGIGIGIVSSRVTCSRSSHIFAAEVADADTREHLILRGESPVGAVIDFDSLPLNRVCTLAKPICYHAH
ncbi:LysE family translocator [Promicromonospora aerolata]|uniref:LysE family translocator n=1 Tax=Promicromonospora aerolata TaxID=195749 RepID=A0ABW4V8H0_9MICO